MKTYTKAVALVFLLAVLVAVPVYAAPNTTSITPSNKAIPSDKRVYAAANLKALADYISLPSDPTALKELVPSTAEDTEARIKPVRSRFLMWTHDLEHVMWGHFGNGYFVGTDNLGKKAWGIYSGGVFAGFYDGEFFSGRYAAGSWKAQNLFGLRSAYGRFTVAPLAVATSATP
jgi:hypothetical protein